MNAKSTPLTPKIKDWLIFAKQALANQNINTASLDSELILAHVLGCNRAHLHAHNDEAIPKAELISLNKYLKLRERHFPIAYILGEKEFYGRKFKVDPNVLIPRPESEEIIEQIKDIVNITSSKDVYLIDVGTGSGCLGITAKLEIPNLNVELIDLSKRALNVALKNAQNLNVDVKAYQNNLLENIYTNPDIVIANLPYVDKNWKTSPETNFEPQIALFADNNGLELINKLIVQAAKIQANGGFLILEADPCQHKKIIKFAKEYSYKLKNIEDYIVVLVKNQAPQA